MNSFLRILTVVVLAGAPVGGASAQESLTLEQAVSTAVQQNQALRGAGHDLDAARWGRLNAVTNFLPKVEISSGVTRIDPESERRANAAVDFIKVSAASLGIPASALSELRPFAYRDTYSTDLTVIQPIYNGGAEIVGLHAAEAAEDRSEYSLQDTEQDVIARVKTSYYTVLKAQELAALARESSERNRRYLDMTRRRASIGTRTQTDVLRWEVQLASGEGAVITSENMLAMARIQLNEVMGVDLNRQFTLEKAPLPDSTMLVASSSSAGTGDKTPDEVRGIDGSFLQEHPSMRVMEANLRLADAGVEKSWVNFKPKVNVAFQYGWEKNSTLSLDGIKPWALMLSISYPIFSGFSDFTGVEKARYELKRTEAQVEGFRRGLLMQATNARLSVRAARQRMGTARKGQEQALDVLNSVTRRYETGGASNVDLLDVQTAYTSAKTDYIAAVYDYLIAGVQVARATGTISR
jgi:outer membrane protein TolC